jgi:hypothetical protein
MNSRFTTLCAASVASVGLSACYVAPVNPPAPYYPQHTVIVAPPPPPAPVTISARLYPINDIASKAGQLTAIITDAGGSGGSGGRGSVTIQFNGDTLQGEASRISANAPYGRITRDVLGVEPSPASNNQRGIANASGPRGSFAQCEYQVSKMTPPTGTGACLFHNGAKYQLHFGG